MAAGLFYGPVIEVDLVHGFSLELNALHRPVIRVERRHTSTPSFGTQTQITSRRVGVFWHFPVLVKYPFHLAGQQWFFGAGPSFRKRQTFSNEASPYGLTAALGLEKRAGPAKLAPTVRYTRWGSLPGYSLRPDQVDVLLSVSF